ncbi:MAG: DUF99 family protein [Nitrososphaera sp.]
MYSIARIHPEKKGIRVLGIAESSKAGTRSFLAGVVMRRDLVIDGLVFGRATIAGDDATDEILAMYRSLERDDVVCMLIGGLVISMYNIIDGEKIYNETGIPIIAVTYEESLGLESSIKARFPNWEEKIALYAKLGPRERIVLKTGKNLFIRCWGISQRNAISILNSFTLQGSLPDPIRVARLAARSLSTTML